MAQTDTLRERLHSHQQTDCEPLDVEIASWIYDDSDSDCDSFVESHKSLHVTDRDVEHWNYCNNSPGLKVMPPDVTVIILQHLSVQEISSVSQVCKATFAASRNPDLWKVNFCSRWNFHISGDDVDWFRSYVCAYENCHDLWLTHWNVVYPCDSLAPGRCCIMIDDKITSAYDESKIPRNPWELSPFYRSGDSKQGRGIPEVVETRAQAIGLATALRLQQHSDLKLTRYSTRRARRTFSKSATLNRRISTQQFDVQSLSFLSDLLFFNVHSSDDEIEKIEERFTSSDLQDMNYSENCLHSWHSVHFSNPDFDKPLKWRVTVQRPDFFTVYPSEGYLRPGATQVVVFGVTPAASYLVQSNFQLSRHSCDMDAHNYAKDNDFSAFVIPPTPFQVQYQYVTPIPCNMFQICTDYHSHLPLPNPHPKLRSVWDDLSASHLCVRKMFINAHVHTSFPLYEFRRNTLVPFDIHSSRGRLHVFCAPWLLHLDPKRWRQDLENISMETENSVPGKLYRTEGPCKESGVFWGERLEELANAYFAEKINCEIQNDRRNEKAKLCGELLRLLVHHKKRYLSKKSIASAFSIFRRMIVEYQDARWLSRRQIQVFTEWKSAILQIYKNISLEPIIPIQDVSNSNRDTRRVFVTTPESQCRSFMDEFEDSSISGLKLAARILSDPKILESFGAHERVRYPGTLYRRAHFPSLPKLNAPHIQMPNFKLKALLSSHQKLAYYKSQNSLDMEALYLVDSFCRRHAAKKAADPDEISRRTNEIEGHDSISNAHTAETRVVEEQRRDHAFFPDFELPAQQNGGRRRIPRLLRFFIYLSTRLGLFVENEANAPQCYIDRRVLISIHWISISLMFVPIFSTLFARYVMLIPSTPVDYSLEGLPFSSENKLRYLTAQECGYAVCSIVFAWLVLGRWIERHTDRGYLRSMLEHQMIGCKFSSRLASKRLHLWFMRLWDTICPLFLQRLLFLVPCNCRGRDVTLHATFWRSHMSVERKYTFDASIGHSPVLLTFGEAYTDMGQESKRWKAFVGILVAISAFWISSPHMGLNALSIFMNGMSFGVSFSLQSMEVGRDELTYRRTGSFLKTTNMASTVLLSCLVGQVCVLVSLILSAIVSQLTLCHRADKMVGSAGGVLFLAEFIVTSVSLLLGGAGTMSVDTLKSWLTFVFYSAFAAFGYATGRAAIVQGIRNKRRCLSSILLCASMILAPFIWWLMAIYMPWDFPVLLIVHRPTIGPDGRVYSAKDLQ